MGMGIGAMLGIKLGGGGAWGGKVGMALPS